MASGSAPAPSRLPAAALGFAIAAALACWNPLAAPFGIIVGIVSAVLGWKALARRRGKRRTAAAAIAIGGLAAVAGAVVVVVTAGSFSLELPGKRVVTPHDRAEVQRLLDDAASRTSAARRRAARELETLPRGSPSRAPPARKPGAAGGGASREASDGGAGSGSP